MPHWWTFWVFPSISPCYNHHSSVERAFGINWGSLGTSHMTWGERWELSKNAFWIVDVWEYKPTLVRTSSFFKRSWKSLFEKAIISVFICVLHPLCKIHCLGKKKYTVLAFTVYCWARIGDQLRVHIQGV